MSENGVGPLGLDFEPVSFASIEQILDYLGCLQRVKSRHVADAAKARVSG
jgi:hypothetical protein